MSRFGAMLEKLEILFTNVFSEKHISRNIDRNSKIGPIELIEKPIKMILSSLSSDHVNKRKHDSIKHFTTKEGGLFKFHLLPLSNTNSF